MDLMIEKIEKPADMNFILGQSHFIKTVEDIHETIVSTNPGMKFGLAFCESSGPALVRYTGNVLQSRRAILATSLRGGGGFEIWQYTSRAPSSRIPSEARSATPARRISSNSACRMASR